MNIIFWYVRRSLLEKGYVATYIRPANIYMYEQKGFVTIYYFAEYIN